MPSAAKLASLDSCRHVAVLPSAEYTPVPMAMISAIAATINVMMMSDPAPYLPSTGFQSSESTPETPSVLNQSHELSSVA